MKPRTSRDLPASPPRDDTTRDQTEAAVKDADKTDQADRDRVHGVGSKLGLGTR